MINISERITDMAVLTDKEKMVFDYIAECFAETGYSPSVRDIQSAVGFASTATVYSYIERLVDKGVLIKDANKSRSLRPKAAAPVYNVPILGKVTAGAPIFAFEEDLGSVTFCTDGRRFPPNSLFALKVRGNSMTGAGIMNGDTVVVEKVSNASEGDIVVALIDDEATVKTFYRDGNRFRLQPENPEYEPIYTDHVMILGRVVASVRYY